MNTTVQAALWMSGAIVSFSSMAVAGRAISLELDTFEIMLFRSIVGFMVVLAVAGATGHLHEVSRRNLGLHALRNLCHFTGQNLWFFALTAIPLAQVFALEFTSPLWAILLSALLLGERITKARALAGVLGFIGILIVARPSADTLSVGQIAAAVAAIGFAGSAVFTRLLTRSETITCVLFYLTAMQAVMGLIAAGYDGDIALPSLSATPWLVLIALAGLLAHFCMTTALKLAPASVVMPVDFLRLPLIAVLGLLVYGEALDLWVLVGAVIIFTANSINIRAELSR
ncbi:DMT family transporter [Thalassovita mediterranea]|jgi:drug/metabolite transporter (DMT)-like permease|uniref:Carboxylate/amino acid/amine transporter n=1 Tax=Thalassovita mediterranea TaxID=340021 RepID=A0A0P1GLJ8_9RHOB|nr:DMT family transporter [Thalassovita mediterranea]CUH83130.1 carboxylate/amino acid/amine transporter [Thalassovita mediterranea]SIS33283.1 EamA domain-containing membrane protein RarD [Thalassovita mediterranea]